MRSFEQRIAEIRRRSEEILKQRKARRKHIFMAGIPLMLVVAALSAFVLPGVMPGDSASGAPAVPEVAVGDGNEAGIARIDVAGEDLYLSYTNPEEILRITDRVYAYLEMVPEDSGSTAGEVLGGMIEENIYGNQGHDGDISGPVDEGFTITFVMRQGGKTEYCLAGDTLTNRTIGYSRTLTQMQIEALKEVLGISGV